MITIIEGAKGSGKTKRIIDSANRSVESGKGVTVFLSTTTRYRTEIKPTIKFIDTVEEGVRTKEMLFGFIKGMLCANYDIEYVYIDGVYKMLGEKSVDTPAMADLFLFLEGLNAKSNVKFVLTISCAKEDLPEYISKYAK